jgi:DNA repair exonuclease SbcCD ATPase subunit
MNKIVMLFKKTLLTALAAALTLAAVPASTVFAAGAQDPTTPPTGQISNERLELAWERAQMRHERVGLFLDRSDEMIARAEEILAKLEAQGKDTTELETALANFEDALEKVQPIYESASAIIAAHAGFDADGKVTDAAQAQQTLKDLRAKSQEAKEAMDGAGKALREAIKAFREANRPVQPTTAPGDSGL